MFGLESTYLDSNATTNALITAHTPKLLERSRAINRRLVRASSLKDVVCAAVGLDGTLLLSSRRGVVGSVGFDNVVLDERVAGPAVERNVRVYVLGVPGAAVLYDALGAGVPVGIVVRIGEDGGKETVKLLWVSQSVYVPSLSSNKVTDVAPRDIVLTARTVVVRDLTLVVGPEGVEEPIVCSLSSGSGASGQVGRLLAGFSLEDKVEGGSEDR